MFKNQGLSEMYSSILDNAWINEEVRTVYISSKCKDYNALSVDNSLLHVNNDELFIVMNNDGILWKFNANDDNLILIDDEEYEKVVCSGSIINKQEEVDYMRSFFYTDNFIFWNTRNIIKKYNIKTEKITEITFKERISKKQYCKNLIAYKDNFIILEDTGRLVMIDNNGEIIWSFLNNTIFSIEREQGNESYTEHYGSGTFNSGLFEYNDYIYLTSRIGGKIIQIKIGGDNNDWKYLGIDAVVFNICENILCTFDSYDGLKAYYYDAEGVVEHKSKKDIDITGMFSMGNKLLASIDKKEGSEMVLIDPATLNIKTLSNNLPRYTSIKDIATNKTDVFIYSNNIYKIPRDVFKKGDFNLSDYCFYDRYTTSYEEEFEF